MDNHIIENYYVAQKITCDNIKKNVTMGFIISLFVVVVHFIKTKRKEITKTIFCTPLLDEVDLPRI